MFDYLSPKDGPVVEGLESQEVVYAKDQPEYIPLRTLVGQGANHPVISRWTFTPEQREAIANGADVFLELSTFYNRETGQPNPLQPIRMSISDTSGSKFAEWFSVCLLNLPLMNEAAKRDTEVERQKVANDEKLLKGCGIKV